MHPLLLFMRQNFISISLMKKLLKRIGRIILGFLILLALYVMAGLLVPYIGVNNQVNYRSPKDVTIFITTNGVHTDIVMPVKSVAMDWSKLVKYADTDLKDSTYPYVGIGWGDKGFYLQTPSWSDLKFSVALKAMTGLSSAAIHATFYKTIAEDSTTVPINLTIQDYQDLIKYVLQSFDLDSSGNSIHIPSTNDGYGDMDAFYEAKGSYSMFHTCNTWANDGLKAAHQRAALWTLLKDGIFRHYQN